ncbi:hypothetical protein niasHS_015585 [Heterodera schachtii]|uniref:RING-type domain-containing protein n=1 Tax=Heterodera schachtii TaxID=97005 RepID=A0ABD2HZ67_HETSC
MSGGTANSTSAPAANTSSSSSTVSSSSTMRAQHNQQPQSSSSSTSSWMNGTTFSVSISTPVEDLNIQFPPIQLPSGISTLFGELAAAHHQQQQQQQQNQQQQMAAIGSSPSTTAAAAPSVAASASSSTSNAALLHRQNGIDANNSAPSAHGPMAMGSSELSAGPAAPPSTSASNCADQTPQQQQQKHRHDQWSSSSRANSSPPTTLWTNSSSNTTAAGSKGRPTNAAAAGASPSYIIPMHSSELGNDSDNDTGPAVAVGTGPGWKQHQIVVNGAKENVRLTTTGTAAAAVPSEDSSNNNDDNGGGFVVVNCSSGVAAPPVGDAPQQRRRRNSNSVLRTSQSADRLSRTARRASRPRNTTVAAASGGAAGAGGGGHRRHTQSVASFVNAAYAAAAQAANNTNGTTSAGGGGSSSTNTNNNANNNRDSIITTTASTDSSSTSSNSTVNGGAGGGGGDEHGGGGGGGNNNNMRNLRQHLRTLFEMRHVAFRQIIQQFPSLFMVGGVFCALCVLVVVLMHFFVSKLVATLALLFSVSHFSDAFAFKRFVTGGQPSGWLIAAKILFRQFMVGTVLGQTQWALPSLLFQPVQHHDHPHQAVPATTTPPPPEGEEAVDGGGTFLLSPYLNNDSTSPTFSSTLYITILAQFFVMDLLLLIKLCVSSVPSSWLGASTKRRIYQWAEYSCALYRFMLPFMPWNAYFGAIWWTVLYGGIKLLFGLALVWAWVLATLRFFRSTHIGSLASEAECGQGEQCTICFSDFRAPIKLKCSHIFCTECIRTWLDREVTCPICRAVVTREDNHFRNGDSMLPCVF